MLHILSPASDPVGRVEPDAGVELLSPFRMPAGWSESEAGWDMHPLKNDSYTRRTHRMPLPLLVLAASLELIGQRFLAILAFPPLPLFSNSSRSQCEKEAGKSAKEHPKEQSDPRSIQD